MEFDIITLGSITRDIFVSALPEIRKHKEHTDICYHQGAKILIDKIHISIGGGGANSAVAFSRLGLKTGFIGAIGNDAAGIELSNAIRKEDVHFLGKIKEGISGTSIILLAGEDRTILTYKGVNNSLSWQDVPFPLKTSWLYISTLLGESQRTAFRLAEHAKKRNIHIAANLSSYEARQGLHKLLPFLKLLDILVLNKEEALLLAKKSTFSAANVLLQSILPGILVITDSHNPAYAFHQGYRFKRKIRKIKPVSTTGAGDAFASAFVYKIIKGRSIPEALAAGEKQARSVLQSIGAQAGLLGRL